jgi:UDP-N-acetylmuramyl pentapeptide synthase
MISWLVRSLSYYLPKTPYVFVYMLQQVEYDPLQFLRWVNRNPDYRRVMRRKKLVVTKMALALLVISYGTVAACIALAIIMALRINTYSLFAVSVLVALVISIPTFCLLTLAFVCWLGAKLLNRKRRAIIARASSKMQAHTGLKIAVLGSYGKTTMKEVLATVLAEGKKVAFSPGNMNVDISHARWIMNMITGDEDVIIFEYGEAKKGDIAKFARMTHPDMAVLTGYAPNHLDSYGSAAALEHDLASIEHFVKPDNLFVSQQAQKLPFKNREFIVFGSGEVLGWKQSNVATGLNGTKLTMTKGKQKLHLHSHVLGAGGSNW